LTQIALILCFGSCQNRCVHTTSASLLDQLRAPADSRSWNRFVELYTPLLYYWALRAGLKQDEASDLVQDVLLVMLKKLPEFSYNPEQSFRGWLRQVTLNKWRENCRRRGTLPEQADESAIRGVPADQTADPFEEVEYRQHLVRRALEIMQAEFQPTTWKACWEFVVSGRPAAEVAAELGVSIDVVYGAKSRVLRRLREELRGLLE
jgi:RNA polymerase sigma-70 factor (ECF subfamily)